MSQLMKYDVDQDGIATIAWNMEAAPMNVINEESSAAFAEAVDRAIADSNVKGVIVTSTKADFIAGADLNMLIRAIEAPVEEMWELSRGLQRLCREMETCGKPFVAALSGTALGGGFEIALSCHYRIAANNPKAQIGLPEVKLGLLPGGGGTQRVPRLIGARAALPLLTQGTALDPKKALAAGLIHAVVEPDELMAAARKYILDGGKAVQPWDEKGYKIPDGGIHTPKGYETFIGGNALLRATTYGNYPAPQAIMACVYHGLQMPIEKGCLYEARQFMGLARSVSTRNMIRTLFFGLNDANKLRKRPRDVEKQKFSKIGVLGAGMMGAGIAYVSAKAGLDVILIDMTQEAADKGKAYSADLLKPLVAKGKMSASDAEAFLAKITATTDYSLLKGAELVIEAVFEKREIKADVTQKAEAVLAKDAIFASNTSTLPITGLAEASIRPDQFIGLHFFSPVDKMPLVEIIMGEKTTQATLARSMDYVKLIKKTPIVVNDSRGFYTSRVFSTYVMEGISMLKEGISPILIDNAGKIAGMPVGPLALADEVALDLMDKIQKQTAKDLGDKYQGSPGDSVAELMVEKLGRVGKKSGKGFYDYPKGEKKRIWPGLAEHFPLLAEQPDVKVLVQRLLHIQAVETIRCLEENVVTSAEDADIGSILGWGFCPFHGGVLSYVDSVGIDQFLADCDRLAQAQGPRFSPPKLLREMAARGESFYGSSAQKQAA